MEVKNWSPEEIAQKVSEIIVDRLSVKKEEVVPNVSFTELGADSLDTVELGMEVEKAFNITLKDEDVEKLGNVQDLIDLIAKMVN